MIGSNLPLLVNPRNTRIIVAIFWLLAGGTSVVSAEPVTVETIKKINSPQGGDLPYEDLERNPAGAVAAIREAMGDISQDGAVWSAPGTLIQTTNPSVRLTARDPPSGIELVSGIAVSSAPLPFTSTDPALVLHLHLDGSHPTWAL